jgi:hypothetical protein
MNKEKERYFGESPYNLLEITKRCESLEIELKKLTDRYSLKASLLDRMSVIIMKKKNIRNWKMITRIKKRSLTKS